MVLKNKKHIISFLVVLLLLLITPMAFAEDTDNNTISADVSDIQTANDDIIYVSNGDNEGDGSQNNPYNSISKAVEQYNSSVNSNIYIKNGNYVFTEQIELKDNVNIVGESKEGTVLDGDLKTSLFKISNKYKITLTNLTFKNANNAPAIDIDFLDTLEVDNCIFENNNNSAIRFSTMWANDPSIFVKNSYFKDNYYVGGSNQDGGAAISVSRGTILNITDSIFEGNRMIVGESIVSQGGAVYAGGNIETVYIDRCEFISNVATKGSAISQYCGGDLYLYNSIFRNNTSPGNSKYNITSSVVYNNQVNSKLLNFYISNNTFEGNLLNDEILVEGNIKLVEVDKNVKITANNVEKIEGDDFNYAVSLTDNNGIPIPNKQIIVTLTNKNNSNVTVLANTTNNEGVAIISLNGVKPGKYSAVAKFEGDGSYDNVSTNNVISIRTENEYNIIFEPDYIHITEGESYNLTAYIYDAYMVPAKYLDNKYSVDWFTYDGRHLVVEGGLYTVQNGNQIIFDVNRCHLVTQDTPYKLYFNVTSIGTGIMTVDLSKNISNVNKDLDIIYVSKTGNDTTGDGSQSNPLETIQTALAVNTVVGGGKTIIVDEGVYEISTFTIVGNVTIIGKKSKTVLKQNTGKMGMLEIDNANTVNLINLTFINGYTTPLFDSLIHVTDESIAYIEGCEFYNNTAYAGGAISVTRGGSVYVNNSYFHENNGMLNTNEGGVIDVDRGYLYVANSIFENNTASDGGVIYLGFPAEADIINSTFINNSAIATTRTEGGGGAIFTRSNNLNIYNSSFINNFAELYGGAIFIDYGAVSIEKSYFENNHVKRGSETKGSTIDSYPGSYCNITMHYSVIISDDEYAEYAVNINNLDENHTADVDYNYWKVTSAKSNIEVHNQVAIVISTDNELIYTGDIVRFTVEFVNYNIDEGNSPLNSSVHDLFLEVIPTIGEVENENITVKDNKATVIYSATEMGRETINFVNIFNHKKYSFNVQDGSNKTKVNATIEIVPDKTSTITVTFDANINGNITISVNDDEYTVEVKDGKAVLDVDTLPGNYEVRVIYTGDETYRGVIHTESFTIDKYETVVSAENITVYYNGVFKAVLKGIEGNPLANETLVIKINNTQYTAITDSEGVATLELNLASVGNYNVITAFSGNSYYKSSNATSAITVKYANVKLTMDEEFTITPLDGVITVKLTDENNNPIKNTEVSIKIINTTVVKTNNEGIAVLNLTNNALNIGQYDITASVDESGVYSSANTKSKLTVTQAQAVLKIDDVTGYVNNIELNAVLTDINGNPIANETIILNVNNGIITVKTDENGKAVVKLNLTSGKYNVTGNLENTSTYKVNTASSTVQVNENTVKLTALDVTVYYSTVEFTAILTDVSGNPVVGENLIISINNVNYIATTDSNGIGKISVDLKIGSYIAVTKFEGNDIFQAQSSTSTIKVLSSISSNDITRGYASPYDFEAILKDANGNLLANQVVTFNVNGKDYNATTDANGVARLNQNLSVGTYAISVTNPLTGEKTANYATIVERITGNKNINMYYLGGNEYKIRVYGDDGNPVGAGEAVTFKINGKTYDKTTDGDGYVLLKFTLKPKSYTLTATYKGFKVSNTVKIKSVVKAKNVKVKKSAKSLKIKVTLKKVNGKYLKSKKITLKFKGKTYKAKTNKKGVATFTIKKNVIKKLKANKKYTYKVAYSKDAVKKTVTVKK